MCIRDRDSPQSIASFGGASVSAGDTTTGIRRSDFRHEPAPGEPHARRRPPNPPAPRDVRSGCRRGGGSRAGAAAFDCGECDAPDVGPGTSRQEERIDRAGSGSRCAAPPPASPSSGLLVAQGTSRVWLALGVAPAGELTARGPRRGSCRDRASRPFTRSVFHSSSRWPA